MNVIFRPQAVEDDGSSAYKSNSLSFSSQPLVRFPTSSFLILTFYRDRNP